MGLPRKKLRKARQDKKIEKITARADKKIAIQGAKAESRVKKIEEGEAFGQRIAGAIAGGVETAADALAGSTSAALNGGEAPPPGPVPASAIAGGGLPMPVLLAGVAAVVLAGAVYSGAIKL